MNQISITVPMEKKALIRASEMLLGLAEDCGATETTAVTIHSKTTLVGDVSTTESTTFMPPPQAEEEVQVPNPETAFGAPLATLQEDSASSVPAQALNDSPLPFVPSATAQAATTSTSTTSATATSVDLDSEGLPWDVRIHSSSKEKIVKDKTWKLKRGVDKLLVDDVKAELRALMSIPAQAPPQNKKVISTFAELMPAMLSAGLDHARILTVLQNMGIASLPALGARQDLIPQVAEALGLV